MIFFAFYSLGINITDLHTDGIFVFKVTALVSTRIIVCLKLRHLFSQVALGVAVVTAVAEVLLCVTFFVNPACLAITVVMVITVIMVITVVSGAAQLKPLQALRLSNQLKLKPIAPRLSLFGMCHTPIEA